MGKIIDAEFGGRNAGDRYCGACEERFPRRSALCPRCGGALTLWATFQAVEKQRKKHSGQLGRSALYLAIIALAIVGFILFGRLPG